MANIIASQSGISTINSLTNIVPELSPNPKANNHKLFFFIINQPFYFKYKQSLHHYNKKVRTKQMLLHICFVLTIW